MKYIYTITVSKNMISQVKLKDAADFIIKIVSNFTTTQEDYCGRANIGTLHYRSQLTFIDK